MIDPPDDDYGRRDREREADEYDAYIEWLLANEADAFDAGAEEMQATLWTGADCEVQPMPIINEVLTNPRKTA